MVVACFLTESGFAAINPKLFGLRWAYIYNADQAAKKSRYYIRAIGCENYGEAVYKCNVEIADNHGYACFKLIIGSSLQVLNTDFKQVPCRGLKMDLLPSSLKA